MVWDEVTGATQASFWASYFCNTSLALHPSSLQGSEGPKESFNVIGLSASLFARAIRCATSR